MKLAKEINSKTKVFKWLSVEEFFFLLGYAAVTGILSQMVHDSLTIFYWIFSVAMAIVLTIPAVGNKKRRVWQAIIIFLRKDFACYKPIPNISKKGKEGESHV